MLTFADGQYQDPRSDEPDVAAVAVGDLWLASRCVACGAASTTQPGDPVPVPEGRTDLPSVLPPVELCDEHWSQLRSDWLLIGWCGDHYGEALTRCAEHGQVIEPL